MREPMGPRAGVVVGEQVFDAARLTGHPADQTVLGILADWPAAQARIGKAAGSPAVAGRPLAATKLLAPILWPSAIYCAGRQLCRPRGRNGPRQRPALEPDPHTLGLKPWHFIKAGRSTVAGPDETVRITGLSKTMDWEIELAAVIGRAAKDVPLERALDYVAGYTIANDLSARDMGAARMWRTRRRSSSTGSRTRISTAPARSGPGSCRRRIFRIRRSLASIVGQRRAQAGFQHQPDDLHAR